MMVRHFPGIYPIISQNLPRIYIPISHWRSNIGYVLLQGIVISHHRYTDTLQLHNTLWIDCETTCENRRYFLVFPSNRGALSESWYVLIILGASPSSTFDVVSEFPSSSPSYFIKTIRCLTNRTLSKSSWDTSRHHPSLSRKMTLLHTLPKIISLETQ